MGTWTQAEAMGMEIRSQNQETFVPKNKRYFMSKCHRWKAVYFLKDEASVTKFRHKAGKPAIPCEKQSINKLHESEKR